jgi:NifU-like protein involved in Fe-S cluster formation
MEYGSVTARYFAALTRAGELPNGLPGLVSGEAEDRTLQVWVRFQLQLEGGIVRLARFQAFGCPHALAAASKVAEWLEGRAEGEARALAAGAVCADLEVPVEKLGKLLRIEDAVAACWRNSATGKDEGR